MRALLSSIALALIASPAFAAVDIPEPGSLALVGVAIAAAVAVGLRKKK